MSRSGRSGTGSDRGSSGFGRIIAAGFLVVVVVVAAALFIVNRKSGDGGAGGGSAAGGSSWNAGGLPMDSRSVADRFEWADRKADINGQMVYKPEPRVGKILSETTRSYSSPTGVEASTARPEGVIFQSIDMANAVPVPFSMSDGPTGFDGNVPVGYTRSFAGAALAAGAYNCSTLTFFPSVAKEKTIVYEPTAEQMESVRAGERAMKEELHKSPEGAYDVFQTGVVNAPDGYTIEAYDGSYARVIIYDRSNNLESGGQSIYASTVDLIWVDHGWMLKGYSHTPEKLDSFPEGMIAWTH